MNKAGMMNEPTLLATLVFAAAMALPAAAEGAMDDYYRFCSGPASKETIMSACGALADRLEALAVPSPEEGLAALKSRFVVDDNYTVFCAGLEDHLHVHPDHPDALVDQAITCTDDTGELGALLRRALDIDPQNHRGLKSLLLLAWGWGNDMGADAESLASYRAIYYEVEKARADDLAAEVPPGTSSATLWGNVVQAARYIVDEADRAGDPRAADAIRARVRRDAGLTALDFGGDERGDSLDLACLPLLFAIGLGDICVSAVEALAAAASAAGTEIPDDVLRGASIATEELRRIACGVVHGATPAGPGSNATDGCFGLATESATVRRLRAALEHHRGPWSSEHHRVHAQGFLGDDARREGLRAALRADPDNVRARCDLAGALAREDPSTAARFLGAGADPECLAPAHVWGDAATFN